MRGRALLRQLFQDRLDLTAAREERRHDVTGPDGVARTRAEKGRTRPLVTRFGQVTVSRIACRSPGRGNVHLLDAALNLPQEKHSHGLRELAAAEAARGSIEAAGGAVARATGVRIGKRQLEELARRAAADVEAFYLQRVIEPAPAAWPLVLTFDGKGIVMLPDALRPATAKAAAAAQGKLAARLSPGEKNGRKRMAELACVYDAAPVPRRPEEIISTPAQKERKNKAQARRQRQKQKPREPQARGKWLTASVTDDIPAVIAAAFDEAERRDPQHKREWPVLIDGNNTQIEAVTAEAARRGITVTIVIDFIHVLEYLWKAAWSFSGKGEPASEVWVADQARKILIGQMVNLLQDGQPVRLSKRAGNVVTLDDLIEAVGTDAARYALARASTDSPIDLDIDLLTSQTAAKPVFCVQYAYARLSALQRHAAEMGISRGAPDGFDGGLLTHQRESGLLGMPASSPG